MFIRTHNHGDRDILGSDLPAHASWRIRPDPEGVSWRRNAQADSIDALLLDLVETIAINGELQRETLELRDYLNRLLD